MLIAHIMCCRNEHIILFEKETCAMCNIKVSRTIHTHGKWKFFKTHAQADG